MQQRKSPQSARKRRKCDLLVVETLEQRQLLAFNFGSLASNVNGYINTLNRAMNSIGNVANDLPFVNKAANEINEVTQTFSRFQSQLNSAISALNNALTDPTQVKDALYGALSNLPVVGNIVGNRDANSSINRDDITINNFNASAGTIEIVFNMAKSFTLVKADNFTGIGGIPLKIIDQTGGSGDLLGLDLLYRDFTFGINASGNFYVNTSAADELKFTLRGNLPSQMQLLLGFVNLAASDTHAGNDLTLDLIADVSNSGQTGLITNPRLVGNTTVRLHLEAASEVRFLPTFRGDLAFDWSFANVSLSSGRSTFGTPAFSLNNVQMNLSSVLNSVLGDVGRKLGEFLQPVSPIVEFLHREIPGISDLTKFTTGKAFRIVDAATAVLPDSIADVVDSLNTILTWTDQITQLAGNPELANKWINVGSLSIGSGGSSLLTAPSAALGSTGPWSFLQNTATEIPLAQTLADLQNQITSSEVGQAVVAGVQRFSPYGGGVPDGFYASFPVFEKPKEAAFKLLMGQDVDLAKFTGRLMTSLDVRKEVFYNILGPLGVSFQFDFNPDINFTLGVDTRGIRDFARSILDSAPDPYQLLKCVYIDEQNTFARLNASVYGGVGLGVAAIASLTVGGGMSANFNAQLFTNWPGNDHDGKLRPFAGEIDPSRLLSLSGEISAGMSVIATILTKEVYKLDIAGAVLLKFDVTLGTDKAQPFTELAANPELIEPATKIGNVLYLNVGPRIADRAAFTSIPDEAYVVSRTPRASSGSITVSAFGQTRDYTGISSIVGDFGSGNDIIKVASNVSVPVSILGGSGNDSFDVQSTGDITLAGQGGDDRIAAFAQAGKTMAVYGDDGTDRITITPGDRRTIFLPVPSTTIVGSGGTGNDLIWINAPLRFSHSTSLDAGGDNDEIRITGGASGDANPLEQFTLVAGAGTDTLTIDDSTRTTGNSISVVGNAIFSNSYPGIVNFQSGAFEKLWLEGGSGDDFYNGLGNTLLEQRVRSGAGNDTVIADGGNVEFRGGSGDDLLRVTGHGDTSAFAFGGFYGESGSDRMELDDSQTIATLASSRRWQIIRPSGDVHFPGITQIFKPERFIDGMVFDSVESTDITSSALSDTFEVINGVSNPSFFPLGYSSNVTIHSREGDDQLVVTSTNAISVDFDGGTGSDSALLNHIAVPASSPWNYAIGSAAIFSSLSGGAPTFSFTRGPRIGVVDDSSLSVSGNDANNRFSIADTKPGQLLSVYGQGGSDVFEVASRLASNPAQPANLGSIFIAGSTGIDTLAYDDSLNPNPVNLTLNANTIPAGFGSISTLGIESNGLYTGSGNDTIVANAAWLVKTNDGDDTIDSSGDATIFAGNGSDTIYSTFERTGGLADGGAGYDYFKPSYDQINRDGTDITWTINDTYIEHFVNNNATLGDLDSVLNHANVELFEIDSRTAADLFDAPNIYWNIQPIGVGRYVDIHSNSANDQFLFEARNQNDPLFTHGVAIDSDTGNDSMTVLSTGTSGRTIHISPGQIGYSPQDNISSDGGVLTFYNIDNATLQTGSGDDRISFVPQLTAWTINAAGQNLSDGLALAVAGIASSPSNPALPSGTINFAGYAPLSYSGFEFISKDSFAPAVLGATWNYDAATPAIVLNFSESISALFPTYITTLRNTTTNTDFSPGSFTPILGSLTPTGLLRYDDVANHVLPDGNYTLTFTPGLAYDAAGNPTLAGGTVTFRVLGGDVNGDGVVGFDDLLTVAQNYGTSGKTYAQGNLDYDPLGLVNFDDLLIISQKYGTSLVTISPSMTGRATRKERIADGLV